MGFPAWTRSLAALSRSLVATMVVRQAPGGGVDLAQFQDDTGTSLVRITAAGGIAVGAVSISQSTVSITTNSSGAISVTHAQGGIRFGPIANETYIRRVTTMVLNTDSVIRLMTTTTAGRMAAATAGVGGIAYDSTLSIPIWSDGTVWRNAAGVAV